MSPKKSLLLILVLTFFTFANALFNGFTGDDATLFDGNPYYANTANIAKVFSREFLLKFENVDFASAQNPAPFSGFVSYRPVVALTFFLDAALWKFSTVGFHISNLLWHLLIIIQLFGLLRVLFANNFLAFWATLLFAVHPIHAELINTIGYRADLCVAFFSLVALRFFLAAQQGGRVQNVLLAGAVASYLLAVFSKESALLLPFLFVILDWRQRKITGATQHFKKRGWFYPLCVAAGIFYVWIYLAVFPNSNSALLLTSSGQGLEKLRLVSVIAQHYWLAFLWPGKVHLLPPMFAPPFQPNPVGDGVFLIIGLGILGYLLKRGWEKYPLLFFWSIFAIIFYVPVSNIILLPNPMGYRFLYLPSMAVMVGLTVLGSHLSERLSMRLGLSRLTVVLFSGVALLLALFTFPLNFFYRSSLTACKEMILQYPDAQRPYLNLGLIHFQKGNLEWARQYFQQYLSTDSRNPFVTAMDQDYYVHHLLGRTLLSNPSEAITHFRQAVLLRPNYYPAYEDLANAYLLSQDPRMALSAALEALKLNPRALIALIYAAHSSKALGDAKSAWIFYQEAQKLAPNHPTLQHLKAYLLTLEGKRRVNR